GRDQRGGTQGEAVMTEPTEPVNPVDQLHHCLMVLMGADPEYQKRCEPTGVAATRNQFNDPDRAFDPNDLTWMEGFHSALRNGVFPDVTALVYVANAFRTYVDAAGELSLDEAFGLKSRQRKGNPSKQLAKDEALGLQFTAMLEYRRDHRGASVQE